jgi:glycine/D-amino acid oxidase-like deaminating enzyme
VRDAIAKLLKIQYNTTMHIAIIGAGFAGLAAAWHLIHTHNYRVTLFDPAGIGGGPSGMAAGLLHPFAGAHSKLNWNGRSGMESTLQLIEASSKALGEPVASNTGLLRPAIKETQEVDFALAASKYSDIIWHSPEECQKMVPGIARSPGIFISSAWTVDCQKYLQGLWKDCPGAEFKQQAINSLQDLSAYDAVVIAMGIGSTKFADVKLNPVKGQLLELEWPKDLPPLPFPISSQAYIVMNPDKKSCIVGSTFEKGFESSLPDLNAALAELKPKYTSLIPALEKAKVIDCRAGVRAGTPNHLPLLQQIDHRTWIIAGLGSKGLLHHALLAEELVKRVTQSRFKIRP